MFCFNGENENEKVVTYHAPYGWMNCAWITAGLIMLLHLMSRIRLIPENGWLIRLINLIIVLSRRVINISSGIFHILSVQRSNGSKIMCFLTQMKTLTALWTTGTVTIEVKPVTASPLHTTVHHSPMPPYTSIPSATSTATTQVRLINAPVTARMWSITIRGPSGARA